MAWEVADTTLQGVRSLGLLGRGHLMGRGDSELQLSQAPMT